MPRTPQYRQLVDGGKEYICTPMHAMDASRLALELVQLVGPAMASLFANAIDLEDGSEVTWAPVVQMILNDGLIGLKRADHDHLMLSFLTCVQLAGSPPNEHLGTEKAFNKHFDEVGLTSAYRLFAWSVEVNLRGHFDDALSLMRDQARARAEARKAGSSSTSPA